ncbi:VWA domain-containing protein [Kordiimonas sp.]|uniref:VWA domain-containing protein n=1 Tax=Kordiimonas sp. TaxID=1970157 RepID=UPI003A908CAE
MSRRHKRTTVEVFGFSFLDVICCGFGAVLLLLIISRVGGEPEPEQSGDVISELRQAFFSLNREREAKEQQRQQLEEDLGAGMQMLARKQAELDAVMKSLQTARDTLDVLSVASNQVESAKMSLDARLMRITPASREEVGGIPVDSDYIIFVIDTSGSMQNIWGRVRAEVESILNIHPKVRGIQIMNDNGKYMFSERARTWIPDSKTNRQLIQRRMVGWAANSNSSPVEGIQQAISDFYDPSRNISIYVLGDEFGGSFTEPVLESIRKANRKGAGGERKVRIHAIGFNTKVGPSSGNFAKLMRQVTLENNGTFLALE